jgi:hypothetical protein
MIPGLSLRGQKCQGHGGGEHLHNLNAGWRTEEAVLNQRP